MLGSILALNNKQYAMSGFTPRIGVASSAPSIMTRIQHQYLQFYTPSEQNDVHQSDARTDTTGCIVQIHLQLQNRKDRVTDQVYYLLVLFQESRTIPADNFT
jgi:hypothetical protein